MTVGHPLIDLQLGNRASIDKNEKESATTLDAKRIQRHFSVLIQLEQRSIIVFAGGIRIKGDHIVFGDAGRLFNRDLFSREECAHRSAKHGGVVRIRFGVSSKKAMPLFCLSQGKGDQQKQCARKNAFHVRLIKGLTGFGQPRKVFALFKVRTFRHILWILLLLLLVNAQAQEAQPSATPARPKRGWVGRILHPFGGSAPRAEYKDPKLRGLTLEVQVSPQPIKLSEVRQLEVKTTLKNSGKGAVTLDFLTDQRIEIFLTNSEGALLTKWSDNHAITEKPGTVTVNPQEFVEYNERIATRELTPNKVFIAEVFYPKYPELRARQKFMTEP